MVWMAARTKMTRLASKIKSDFGQKEINSAVRAGKCEIDGFFFLGMVFLWTVATTRQCYKEN
jgi:hypothetical protein